MTTPRYTVYDTEKREYLQRVETPDGDQARIVTYWTRDPAEAARFPGVKSAAAVVRMLGSYSQFAVKNAKGEIIA